MDKITKSAAEGLYEYFDKLSQYGSVSGLNTDHVMTLILLDDFTHSNMSVFFTEGDMRDILKYYHCLVNHSCMIPFKYSCIK